MLIPIIYIETSLRQNGDGLNTIKEFAIYYLVYLSTYNNKENLVVVAYLPMKR